MIKVNEVAFVGYPVTDKQKAVDFYEGIFNLKRESGHDLPTGFWYEYDIAGTTLAISSYWEPGVRVGPSIAFEVDDFDATISELKAKGVPFKEEPFDSAVCHFAVITDPDGNLIVIHKRKPKNA